MPEVKSELTPEEEKLCIRDISISAEAQTKEGDTFYLITQRCLISQIYVFFFPQINLKTLQQHFSRASIYVFHLLSFLRDDESSLFIFG